MKKFLLSLVAAALMTALSPLSAQTASTPNSVMHVVTVSWKKDAKPAQIFAALDAAQKLPAAFPGILHVWTKTLKAQGDRTHVIVMEFASEQALKDYAGSAAQKEWYSTYEAVRDRSTTFDVTNGQQYWPGDGKFPGRGQVSGWKDFPKHNADRRMRFAVHRADDQDGLVFVGDSITEGWQTQAEDFAALGVKIVNRGIGGDTTPNLLYRLQDDVLSLRPRALVMLIGTNDLGQHTPPADIAANLTELLTRIRAAYPKIPIAWCLVMPRGDGPQYPAEVKELNVLIKQLAATDPLITVCDTYTPLAMPDGRNNPADFKPDNLHLNPTGYAAWREALLPVVSGWNLKK
jgi:lysophospholipase L1-like esterase